MSAASQRVRCRSLLALSCRHNLTAYRSTPSAFRVTLPRARPRRFASSVAEDQSPTSKPSLFRRAASVLAIGIILTTLGFTVAASPAISTLKELKNPPTDADTLSNFIPVTDEERAVEAVIQRHPLVREMRMRKDFSEMRGHHKTPASYQSHHLISGALTGPGKVAVPPLVFTEAGGKSLVSITYLGQDLCGHPGIIHGGMLATLLDEALARCCFGALPHQMGVTANLSINYRAPTMAGTYVVLRATTTKVEGRKAWVEGRVETLVAEGEKPVVVVEATALFIEPRKAAMLSNLISTS